jgi:hypothetical protein
VEAALVVPSQQSNGASVEGITHVRHEKGEDPPLSYQGACRTHLF